MEPTPHNHYDVIVVGGGPGGCTATTYLRQAGRRVLLLEKKVFPRFHIGESLLPYNQPILQEMGVSDALNAVSFPKKYGVQFHIGDGSTTTRFDFRGGRFTCEYQAIQVERATFDHILLKHARSQGGDVREGWKVFKFASDETSVTVEAKNPSDEAHTFTASFLIDASGRGNFTGNHQGLRDLHPRLRKLAVFGHFFGVSREDGERAGDTVITRLDDKWFWIIPISSQKTSVGLVIDQDEFKRSSGDAAEVFHSWIELTPPMRTRMQGAKPAGAVQVTSDFSYQNRRFTDRRLLRVGDAAGFIDPIFSAGVYLAMWSGKLAAKAIQAALAAGDNGIGRFATYERKVRREMRFYGRMAEQFYTKPFMELFMAPRDGLSLPAAVNAVLAGEMEGGWPLRWRLAVFFALVRLQRLFPLVPRLSFAPTEKRTSNQTSGSAGH